MSSKTCATCRHHWPRSDTACARYPHKSAHDASSLCLGDYWEERAESGAPLIDRLKSYYGKADTLGVLAEAMQTDAAGIGGAIRCAVDDLQQQSAQIGRLTEERDELAAEVERQKKRANVAMAEKTQMLQQMLDLSETLAAICDALGCEHTQDAALMEIAVLQRERDLLNDARHG